jgi:hypothetical protein
VLRPGIDIQRRVECADEVEADADDPGLVEGSELITGDRRRHHGNAAEAGISTERVHQIAVVGSEKARLDEHGMGYAIRVQHPDVILGCRVVVGRVTAHVGEGQAPLEDMRMRVHGRHGTRRLTCDDTVRQYADCHQPQ